MGHNFVEQIVRLSRFESGVYGSYATVSAAGYSLQVLAHLLARLTNPNSDTITGLRQLAGALSGSSLRLFVPCGIIGELENILTLSYAGGWKDPRTLQLLRLQSATLIVSYITEHMTWAASVAPKLIKINTAKWSTASCYAWCAWIVLQCVAIVLRLRELKRVARTVRELPHSRENLSLLAKRRADLYLHLIRNVFRMPPALQWCLPENPFLTAPQSHTLLLIDALIGFYVMWVGRGTSLPALKLADAKSS